MADGNPIDPAVQAMIDEWYACMAEFDKIEPFLKPLVERERKLRQAICAHLWPADKFEGTQYHDLGAGYRLKANIKIKREIDEAALPAVEGHLQGLMINTSDLFPRVPRLDLKIYRGFTAEQQAIINQALIIKPESPTLEYVKPEKK